MTDAETTTPRARNMLAHWANIAGAAHERVRGAIADDKQAHVAAILDRFEADLAPLLAPFFADLLANPDTPESIRELVSTVVAPEHFSNSLVIGIALGALLSPLAGAAVAPLVQDVANASWRSTPTLPLSAPDLAAAVLKGVMSFDAAQPIALDSGYSANAFRTLVDIAGQAIGVEEALLLYRRGDIDENELARVVHYSNVRSDFLPDILKLKYLPPGAGEVISGALKGHLSDADAQAKLNNAGIDPANYGWLKATAGRPPGTMEMLELWNRGEVSEAEVDAAVRQSDINDAYLNQVKLLRVRYPPPRTIPALIRAGSLSDARALQLLEYAGLPADLAAAYVAEGHTTRTAALRELSASQVIRAYEERLIDQPTAHARITALHYPDADATLMLEIADNAVVERYRNAQINRVHSRYVMHKETQAQANVSLASFGLPGAAITELLGLWSAERAANVAVPTLAQSQGALRRGVITQADFIARAHALGYSGIDVKIVLAEAYPPTAVPAEILALDPATL